MRISDWSSDVCSSDLQARVLQWLMFQMGGVGPMFGQLHHFRRYAAHESYSLGRYEKEVHRLYAVLDKELGERPYLASDDYSIADIATYPWIARFPLHGLEWRSEEHTSELKSLMRISYAVFCLKKNNIAAHHHLNVND